MKCNSSSPVLPMDLFQRLQPDHGPQRVQPRTCSTLPQTGKTLDQLLLGGHSRAEHHHSSVLATEAHTSKCWPCLWHKNIHGVCTGHLCASAAFDYYPEGLERFKHGPEMEDQQWHKKKVMQIGQMANATNKASGMEEGSGCLSFDRVADRFVGW